MSKAYTIKRHSFHVAIPPQRAMSYDEASYWMASQAPGVQMYYYIDSAE